MTLFSDPSFFILLSGIIAGAAALGLTGHSLKRYGLVTSLLMLGLAFFPTPVQGLAAALHVAIALVALRVLLRDPKGKARFRLCLAAVLAPLVIYKVGAVFGQNLLGFLGISYLTFRAAQMLIEAHDGIIREASQLDTLYFLVFFPTFTSGPIDRSRRFQEDLDRPIERSEYAEMLAKGILLIMGGMVYKIVFSAVCNRYNVAEAWDATNFWFSLLIQVKNCYAYGLYLFFDFAGYSMMAIGTSLCLGIRTPRNFRAPFLATSISDFWKRWHITLSEWLRDFVFMRLLRGLMRRKTFKSRLTTSQVALICNMTLMGAWHGLTPDYLLYGLYHGLLLAANTAWEKGAFHKRHRHQTWYRVCSWFVTMQLVFFGFALFSGQLSKLVKGA